MDLQDVQNAHLKWIKLAEIVGQSQVFLITD
jgi:hypothetical protein